MKCSDIFQCFQEHLKKNIWKFSILKSNFFKCWLVSNFGLLDFSNGLVDRQTQQNGRYHRHGASGMRTLPLKLLQICIITIYLNISKNMWKKIFENFRPKKSNFFKCSVVSKFGWLEFYNDLMDSKTQENGIYRRSEKTTMQTLHLQLLGICIVTRYLNLSKNIWKKTFENFRPKNISFSNA